MPILTFTKYTSTMIITKLKEMDTEFHSYGNTNRNETFDYTNRESTLILSAPHSTKSFANKKEKLADLYTGALVKYLGQEENISTIVRVKYTPYKDMISDYIANNNLENHYFLDIHGFSKPIRYDICFGIADSAPIDAPNLQKLLSIAHKYNLKTIVNHPNYSGTAGLTGRYLKKFNKPNVIQIELSKKLRDFYENPEIVKEITIPMLREFINCFK